MQCRYRTVVVALLACIVFGAQSVFAGEGTGANAIFNLIGVDRPAEWGTWKKEQKHGYLRSLGAYPPGGKKYKGEVDLERYFAELGVAQPTAWHSMSFVERKAFVQNVKNPAPAVPVAPVAETPVTEKEPVIEGSADPLEVTEETPEGVSVSAPTDSVAPEVSVIEAGFPTWVKVFLGLVAMGVVRFAIRSMRR